MEEQCEHWNLLLVMGHRGQGLSWSGPESGGHASLCAADGIGLLIQPLNSPLQGLKLGQDGCSSKRGIPRAPSQLWAPGPRVAGQCGCNRTPAAQHGGRPGPNLSPEAGGSGKTQGCLCWLLHPSTLRACGHGLHDNLASSCGGQGGECVLGSRVGGGKLSSLSSNCPLGLSGPGCQVSTPVFPAWAASPALWGDPASMAQGLLYGCQVSSAALSPSHSCRWA